MGNAGAFTELGKTRGIGLREKIQFESRNEVPLSHLSKNVQQTQADTLFYNYA